ncbi:MAG: response regulator transcription factor [bacterium]|nr:response regulator transcription factor [bacterium]
MKSRSDNSPYKILLADDHMVLRLGLRNLLGREDSILVVGEAANGEELLELIKHKPCDLVILDLSMPGMNGIQVLEKLRVTYPAVRVLIFTMHKEHEFFRHAVRKGVDGYVLKDDNLELILQAIQEIRAGRKYYSAELTAFALTVEDEAALPEKSIALEVLTRREREILTMIASGATSKEIADDLAISHRTVQTHRSNLLEKLGLKNTAALVKFAVSMGLVD